MIIVDKCIDGRLKLDLMFNNRNNFNRAINFIKKNSVCNYDPENKEWLVKPDKDFIDKLTEEFDTSFKRSYYQLLDKPEPITDTPPRLIKEEYGDLKEYYNRYDYGNIGSYLFDFQKIGVISGLYTINKYNGFLLADDVGLGKTVQAIAIMKALMNQNKVDKVVIISPKNVKYQWKDEIENFTKDVSAVVVDSYNKEKRLEKFDVESDVYILNHDQIKIDEDYNRLTNLDTQMVIIDEIHAYKNSDTNRTKVMKELKDIWEYRLGLTATPIANDLTDLYNVMQILIPDYLGKWKDFSKKHIKYHYNSNIGRAIPVGYKNLFEVKKQKARVSIQRKRQEVEDDMPEPHTKNHELDINQQQSDIHTELSQLIEEKKEKLNKTDKQSEINKLEESIQGLMTLQIGVADSPEILLRSDSNYVRKLASKHIRGDVKSNKLEYINKLVKDVLGYNNKFKIIIFSRFSTMVNIIIERLNKLDVVDNIAHVEGSLSEKHIYEEIKKFKNNDDTRVIVTTDAGNEGVNLQEASHLINVDMPWNPKTLIQRNGRMVRIGSPWDDVFISNLVSRNTIEERVMEVLDKKRQLIKSTISNTNEEKEYLSKITKIIS